MPKLPVVFYDTAQLSKLETAKNEGDWFTAIVLSATQLERHGYIAVKDYMNSLKVNPVLIDKMLDRIQLSKIAGYLLALEIIDNKENEIILKINKERNNFVHRKEKEKFVRGKEAKEKYEPLVDECIRILKEKLNAERIFIGK